MFFFNRMVSVIWYFGKNLFRFFWKEFIMYTHQTVISHFKKKMRSSIKKNSGVYEKKSALKKNFFYELIFIILIDCDLIIRSYYVSSWWNFTATKHLLFALLIWQISLRKRSPNTKSTFTYIFINFQKFLNSNKTKTKNKKKMKLF